jgi:hypothetical protein
VPAGSASDFHAAKAPHEIVSSVSEGSDVQGPERDSAGIGSMAQPKDISVGRGPKRGAALHIRTPARGTRWQGALLRALGHGQTGDLAG